jgi:hypothetical protein
VISAGISFQGRDFLQRRDGRFRPSAPPFFCVAVVLLCCRRSSALPPFFLRRRPLRCLFFAPPSLFLRLRLAAPISCGRAPPFEGLNALFFADLGRRARTTVIFYYFCTK